MGDAPRLSDEDKKAIEDGKSWEEFGVRFGWKLYGWTYHHKASFIVEVGRRELIDITELSRKTIDAAFERRAQQSEGAQAKVVEGWRSIETAPKDGTVILAAWPEDGHREIIRWYARGGWHGDSSGWWSEKNWPRFWQPLPSPPRQTEEKTHE